uniref:Wsv423-like protein n=1 Tax=Penaeus monodon majanivirus B TaxID=2984272 RepID=A0A9C7BLV9_9VIRU|nr:MAG: wsv423-like protein [Penaeus monodon majanivirus B]
MIISLYTNNILKYFICREKKNKQNKTEEGEDDNLPNSKILHGLFRINMKRLRLTQKLRSTRRLTSRQVNWPVNISPIVRRIWKSATTKCPSHHQQQQQGQEQQQQPQPFVMIPVPETKTATVPPPPPPPPPSAIAPATARSTMPSTPLLYDCAPIYDMVTNIGRSDTLTDIFDLCQKLALDSSSIERLKEGSVSLMSVLETLCRFNNPNNNNNVCRINTGIYYIAKTNTVIKFLFKFNIDRIEDFLKEIYFGLIIREVKGIVNIQHVYPEAFCYEMPFLGLSLDYLLYNEIRSNTSLPHFVAKGMASGLMDGKTLIDGRTLIDNCMKKFVHQLPNVIIEMGNILMRLGDQRIICLDIKPDNFVIDIHSGRPYLIDLGFMTAAGTKYTNYDFNISMEERYLYPQSPPELLDAEVCVQKSMTYGLSYTLEQIINRLKSKGYDVLLLSENRIFKKWIEEGRRKDIDTRPEIHEVINIVRTCYPMLPPIDI